MSELITTEDVAKQVGILPTSIATMISRYPHLRPAKRIGLAYVWTQEEVDRLIAHRASGKRGKPRKQAS